MDKVHLCCYLALQMDKYQTMAEYLGLTPPEAPAEDLGPRPEDITDPKAFAQAILESREFRRYIVDNLTLGELPAAIICRLMDYAWGKPAERVEHSGRVETISEVRRVIIHVESGEAEALEPAPEPQYTKH